MLSTTPTAAPPPPAYATSHDLGGAAAYSPMHVPMQQQHPHSHLTGVYPMSY